MTSLRPVEPGSQADLRNCLDELRAAHENDLRAHGMWVSAAATGSSLEAQRLHESQVSHAEWIRAYYRLRAAIEATAQLALFSCQ